MLLRQAVVCPGSLPVKARWRMDWRRSAEEGGQMTGGWLKQVVGAGDTKAAREDRDEAG